MKQSRLTLVIAHIAGWIFFFSLVAAFLYNSPGRPQGLSVLFSGAFLVFGCTYLFLFYFNTYVLIPGLYLRKKYIAYGALVVGLLLVVWFIQPFDNLMVFFTGRQQEGFPSGAVAPGLEPGVAPGPVTGDRPPPPPSGRRGQHTDIISIVLFLTVWSLSTAICIIRQWRLTEKRAIQAEADRANAELSFLKAQVNPHFLFNTLNNIYSLAVTKSEYTAASILKLSNIMRYVTEDIKEDFVSLQEEIACVSDYVDLQKLRLGKKTTVDFSVEGIAIDKRIAPLVLMTFIENAFKYGASNHHESPITISLIVRDSTIEFYCKNRIFPVKEGAESTGIGISNTRERLNYLYPGRHTLDIHAINGYFTIQLILQV